MTCRLSGNDKRFVQQKTCRFSLQNDNTHVSSFDQNDIETNEKKGKKKKRPIYFMFCHSEFWNIFGSHGRRLFVLKYDWTVNRTPFDLLT